MSTSPGVGTSVDVKSPPGLWGRLEVEGWGLKLTSALDLSIGLLCDQACKNRACGHTMQILTTFKLFLQP